jgi:hypothetical protein
MRRPVLRRCKAVDICTDVFASDRCAITDATFVLITVLMTDCLLRLGHQGDFFVSSGGAPSAID